MVGKNLAKRPSAAEWQLSDKHPELLPTPWLGSAGLEDFTEALLVSQRLLGSTVRHVAHVERWGVPGDKQDGIDFFGRLSDGTPVAWQVKQLARLSASDVRSIVDAVTFTGAEELYLVFGGIAAKQARAEMLEHDHWTLLDRRTLTEMVRLLPPFTQRELIERFWGRDVRRTFISGPGDAFISFEAFQSARLNPNALLNDCGPLAGRSSDLEALAEALDRKSEFFRQIVVVGGPGGRGKTRLVVEALGARQRHDPTVPVICLSAGHSLDVAAVNELPSDCVVFVDDAHNDTAALIPLLAAARAEAGM